MRDAPRILLAILILLLLPATAMADPSCVNGGWNEEHLNASSGDSGLGGTGASGDDSGLGGTGIASDDSGIGGTGVTGDDSGLGGTGIFGTITSMGSICVNGERVHFADDVEIVFENGVAYGAEGLAVGQTVWLVALPSDAGLSTEQIWVLDAQASPQVSADWLRERIEEAGELARLSLEGPVDGWVDGERFAVHGIVVDAGATRDVRDALDAATQVRVSGAVARDGIIRVDSLSVRPQPPPRPPVRPPTPPRIERPTADRPDVRVAPRMDMPTKP